MTSNIVRANFNFYFLATTLTPFMLIKIERHWNLQSTHNWLTSNKLFLNIKKSNYIIFRPYKKNSTMYDPQVNVFDNESNKKVTLECKNVLNILDC